MFSYTRMAGLLAILIILQSGCQKERLALQWDKMATGTEDDLYCMTLSPDGEIWVAGGDSWHSGVVLHSPDEGNHFTIRHQTDKALLTIHHAANGAVWATGVDGHIWRFSDTSGWTYAHPNYWAVSRGMTTFPNGQAIVVGGNAFESGYMFTSTENNETAHLFEHLNRINAVETIDSSTAFCVGYGVVYRTDNQGNTWSIQDVYGDHYMAIHFPEPETGYIVGYGGSILKTTNRGSTWENQHGKKRLSVSSSAFRDVYFQNAQRGVIVGDEGTAWFTKNGGSDWIILEGLPQNTDFLAVGISGNYLFVAGTNGAVYRATLP
ncbi:MAG: hypothetical protein KA479_12955 [Saprospiraceae bacterium]|nr:hypothetical protein [Saprospiraceae bacterium]